MERTGSASGMDFRPQRIEFRSRFVGEKSPSHRPSVVSSRATSDKSGTGIGPWPGVGKGDCRNSCDYKNREGQS